MKMRKKSLAILLFSIAFVCIVVVSALVLWQKEAFSPAPTPNPPVAVEKEDGNLYPALGQNGLWGFIDSKGQMVVQPAYEQVDAFVGQVAWVKAGGYWGAVDKKGQLVIPCDYGKRTYVDLATSPLVVASANRSEANSHEQATTASLYNGEGLKIFGVDGKIGQLNNGLMAFSRLKDGFELWGYVDNVGKIVVEPVYKAVGLGDKAHVMVMDFSDQKYILSLYDGSVVEVAADVQLDYLDSKRILQLGANGRYGYLGVDGKEAIPFDFFKAEVFHNGSALVKNQKGYGLIDQKGKFIVEPIYGQGEYLGNGYYSLKKEGDVTSVIVDSKGAVVVDGVCVVGSWWQGRLQIQTADATRFIQSGSGLLESPVGKLQYNLYAMGNLLGLFDDNGMAYYKPDGTLVYTMGRDVALADDLVLSPQFKSPLVYYQIYYPQIVASSGKNLSAAYESINQRLEENALGDYITDYQDPNDSVNFMAKGNYKLTTAGDVVTVLQKTQIKDIWVNAHDGNGSEDIYTTLAMQKSTGRQFALSSLFVKGVNWRNDLLAPLSEIYSVSCAGKGQEENPQVVEFLQKRLDRDIPYALDENSLTIYAKLDDGSYEPITLRYQDFEGIIDQKGDLWVALHAK